MARRAAKDDVYVALLRGINVGGKNKLPMKSLVTVFEQLGCTAVKTYIQSGNVVFRAPPALAARLPERVSAEIAARFRLSVPVIVRSAAELRVVVRDNPHLAAGAEPDKLHVAFLADGPAAAAVARLDPERSPPDELVVRGREIHLHLPNGVGRSKLTNQYFDRVLSTTSTLRNWKTVLALLELTETDIEHIAVRVVSD